MLERPFFSIVMPTYNVEKYLAQAIACVLEQTFGMWELIIVDDCSTDQSGIIADRFEQQDERITVIHFDENRKVYTARNAGMKLARGQYILFLDPDDTYENWMLMMLHDSIRQQPAEIVVFSINEDYQDEKGKVLYTKKHELPTKHYTELDEIHHLVMEMESETMYGYPWNKAFSLNLLRREKAEYPAITHVEDILFNVAAFEDVRTVTVLSEKPYHYRNSGQVRLTGKYLPNYLELQKTRFQAIYDQQERWGTLDERGLNVLSAAYFRSFLSSIEREIEHGTPEKASLLKARHELESDLFAKLKNYLPKGRSNKLLYQPLADGDIEKAYKRAKLIFQIKNKYPFAYAKLKQMR